VNNTRQHILFLGRADQVLRWVLQLSSGAITSLLVRSRDLATQRGLAEHRLVVGIGAGAAIGDWVSMAEAVHRAEPVTAVVGMTDTVMSEAAEIGAALGVRAQPAILVRTIHDKVALRRYLNAHGLGPVPFAEANGEADVLDFGDRYGWPVVMKPTRGSGSAGVTRVTGPDQVSDAFAFARAPHALTSGEALVEACLSGPLLGVEAFSEEGEHEIITVFEEYVAHPRPYLMTIVAPATVSSAVRRDTADLVRRVLDEIGVRDGPSHWEVIATAAGPRIVEGHLRESGDRISRLLQLTTGVDIHELWARQLLGQQVLPRLRRLRDAPVQRPAAAVQFAASEAGGELADVEGLAQVRDMPGVVDVELLVQPGMRVRPVAASADRCALLIATGDTPTAAVAAAREAAARLRFVVVPDAPAQVPVE